MYNRNKPVLESEHSYLVRDRFSGGTRVLGKGGLNPPLPLDHLTVMLKTIHRRSPPLINDGK
jgi:hypothetical protein